MCPVSVTCPRCNSLPGLFVFEATNYRLDALASLLVGVLLLWGVGILEGFPPCWRDPGRGVVRLESPTVSDASEHTDWMSEMSKSEASLPLRLLPLLPALLPGRLKCFLISGEKKIITDRNHGWERAETLDIPVFFFHWQLISVASSNSLLHPNKCWWIKVYLIWTFLYVYESKYPDWDFMLICTVTRHQAHTNVCSACEIVFSNNSVL